MQTEHGHLDASIIGQWRMDSFDEQAQWVYGFR
jgi:hypothetical protein